jgi:hypothetical protein
MKTRISLVIAVVLLGTKVFATIHTVSNDANRPAQSPDVQTAIGLAVAGDTIYVNGTQYLYPDFTVNKKLVIIGAGYNSSNQLNLISQVNNIYFMKDSGTQDGTGSVITGFKVNGSIGLAGSTLTITNIRLFRNMISYVNLGSGYTTSNNWTMYNNIFFGSVSCYTYSSTGCTNVIIQNNIFTQNSGISNFSQSSVVIDHNLFVHGNAFSSIQFATITNNIITSSDNTQVMAGNVTSCTFNANISLSQNICPGSTSGTVPGFLAQGNTGGSNIVGSDPLFTTCSDFNNYNGSFNYRLQSTSPGYLKGTDGTDIGIYGGTYAFPSGGAPGSGYDMSAFPPIPQVTNMNIQNASVLPGAQLKVSVQATVNN